MDKRTIQIVGIVLILIAIILGIIQHFVYNMYGASSNKWYFYSLLGVIGIIGIILLILPYITKQEPSKPQKT